MSMQPPPHDPYDATQIRPSFGGVPSSGHEQQYGGSYGPPPGPYGPQYPGQSYPPPGPGYPPMGAAGQIGPAGPMGQPPSPVQRPWLKPVLIGAAALLTVIVLVLGVVALTSGGNDKGGETSPGATVKAYFAALQAGDAERALSYGAEAPASKELLTNEVLKKQTTEAPIKDLNIVSESGGYTGKVHFTVTIGNVAYDEDLMMEKSGDVWKLKTAAVKLEPSLMGDVDKTNLTIFDKPLPASGVAYVFPGALDLGSKNKNLKAVGDAVIDDSQGQASVKGLAGYGGYLSVKYTLSDAAQTEARNQLAAKYAQCAASKDGYPSDCPQSNFEGERGTYTWTAPDAQAVQFDKQLYGGKVNFTDQRDWTFTALDDDNRPISGSDSTYVSGSVTVSADSIVVDI